MRSCPASRAILMAMFVNALESISNKLYARLRAQSVDQQLSGSVRLLSPRPEH